jgi:pimeloyl-ACP methyl ester carboxylesterase
LLPVLDEAGFAPVPITLPGLGANAEGFPSFRKADLARWLRAEIARREIRRFALIGHDWGATVAALVAASLDSAVAALIVEEEILPGIGVDIPAPGNSYYPTWHGPFNRAVGLAEQLVPEREAAYYGAFLRQSAGPAGLDPAIVRSYVNAYSAPGILEAGLAYYRSRLDDLSDVQTLVANQIATPVLAIGGRFAMGGAVADGMRAIAQDVTSLILDDSGHYPLEQEPGPAGQAVVEFLHRLRLAAAM